MKWYSGPIQDAIASAKHDQKIFLVFVEGKDETSKNMTKIITEEDVSRIIDEHCVSVKLITDSEPFRQFSQIYPVIVVPSMFFIGNNGIPLEVIAGSENKEELTVKIQKAIQLHKSKLPDAAPSSSSATTASAASTSSSQEPVPAEAPETLTVHQAPSVSDKEEAPSTSVSEKEEAKAEEPSTSQAHSELSEEQQAQALLKQKLERAEQLMAERRRIREKEEKEAEKERELEQRRAGRELLKAKEQMKEKEMADWAKQRQREKQEDKAARERVLAQIAQDKADRAAKFQYSSGSSPPPSNRDSNEISSVRQRSTESASTSASSQSKIQFRLPNSSAVSHEFPSGATLNDVYRHVKQVIKPGISGFSLATSFPRRHFARADYSRTLAELELCPSAVLLILPGNAVAATSGSNSSSRVWALLWTVLSPLTFVWNFLYSFVFGSGSTQPTGPLQNDLRAAPPSASTGPQQNNRSAPNKAGSSQKPAETTSRYRKDGNIHHLSNESSNDDEDGTWNGNSTQQM